MSEATNAGSHTVTRPARVAGDWTAGPDALLLREAHHRIKNNLQLIATMLEMQARQNRDVPGVHEALVLAGHRVLTVARLHDQLQDRADGRVDAGAYLHDLCAKLSECLGLSASRTVVVEAPAVLLASEQVLRLGMIVTELVTNAAKYATTPSGGSNIKVVLTPGYRNAVHLLVADTGPGIPPGAWDGFTHSLGLQLVRHLTRAIGGRLAIDGTPPGARFTVRLASDDGPPREDGTDRLA